MHENEDIAIEFMAAGNAVSKDARSFDQDTKDEDWRKYLVNTALSQRLRAVNSARQQGPKRLGDDSHRSEGEDGDEVAV